MEVSYTPQTDQPTAFVNATVLSGLLHMPATDLGSNTGTDFKTDVEIDLSVDQLAWCLHLPRK